MLNKKCFIEGILFEWLAVLNEFVKINRNLLTKLCTRWVERRANFLLSVEVVRFNLLDVCLGLRLRVDADKIDLNEVGVDGKCRKYFPLNNVIYDFLLE